MLFFTVKWAVNTDAAALVCYCYCSSIGWKGVVQYYNHLPINRVHSQEYESLSLQARRSSMQQMPLASLLRPGDECIVRGPVMKIFASEGVEGGCITVSANSHVEVQEWAQQQEAHACTRRKARRCPNTESSTALGRSIASRREMDRDFLG